MNKIGVILSLILILPCVAFAEESSVKNYLSDIGTKFGRGIENVITSPAEIPCTVETEMHKGDRVIRFFSGFGKGTVYFLRRALVGVTEVGTFIIPMDRTIPRVCKEEPVGVVG